MTALKYFSESLRMQFQRGQNFKMEVSSSDCLVEKQTKSKQTNKQTLLVVVLMQENMFFDANEFSHCVFAAVDGLLRSQRCFCNTAIATIVALLSSQTE